MLRSGRAGDGRKAERGTGAALRFHRHLSGATLQVTDAEGHRHHPLSVLLGVIAVPVIQNPEGMKPHYHSLTSQTYPLLFELLLLQHYLNLLVDLMDFLDF